MDQQRIEIRSDGDPGGTRVLLNGEDITTSVRRVTWDHGVHDDLPTAEVELLCVEGTMQSGKVMWMGLEDIPAEALRDELERRDQSSV